ncbi:MAG: hypothetical protein H8F28_09895 [Fibrella sp.]|nr:hypothetical protein [Armatimonadota bacterium]
MPTATDSHFDQANAEFRRDIDIQARVDDFKTQNGFPIALDEKDAPTVRALLREQIALESTNQGDGDTELIKLCCAQLFSLGLPEDIALIWDAKHASMDTACAVDVQLLCGMGLPDTIAYLHTKGESADRIRTRIEDCVRCGDFNGFAPEAWLKQYAVYYWDESPYAESL